MKARYSTIALVAVPVPSPIIEAELPFTFTDFSPFLFHFSGTSVGAGFRLWPGEIEGNFERELNNRADLLVICDRHLSVRPAPSVRETRNSMDCCAASRSFGSVRFQFFGAAM